MRLTPSAMKRANAWGLYDMEGNVWQWCSDVRGYPNNGEATDPYGPDHGHARVLRGGSWYRTLRSAAAVRPPLRPAADTRDDFIGFRVVLDSE